MSGLVQVVIGVLGAFVCGAIGWTWRDSRADAEIERLRVEVEAATQAHEVDLLPGDMGGFGLTQDEAAAAFSLSQADADRAVAYWQRMNGGVELRTFGGAVVGRVDVEGDRLRAERARLIERGVDPSELLDLDAPDLNIGAVLSDIPSVVEYLDSSARDGERLRAEVVDELLAADPEVKPWTHADDVQCPHCNTFRLRNDGPCWACGGDPE